MPPQLQQADDGGLSFMDCVVQGLEHSIDILSCDETNVRKGLGDYTVEALPDLLTRNYAKLHDEFLESLLQEQTRLQEEQGPPEFITASPARRVRSEHTSRSFSSTKSVSSELQPMFGAPMEEEGSYPGDEPTPKRKRPLKLTRKNKHKKSPLRKLGSQRVAPADDATATSLISCVTKRSLPLPPTYIHSLCKLQKDKGKGEKIGTDICATGSEPCLEKLRAKMELLTQVSLGSSKGASSSSSTTTASKKSAATMKRRKAKITDETAAYTETRSIIELRMGFLSMQYGILLRWDTRLTGKVMLVVLRKMCPESFYKTTATNIGRSMSSMSTSTRRLDLPILTEQNHVVLQRADGMEVTLLEHPYRVNRPYDFSPSLISVAIMGMQGFKKKSAWTVSMHVQDEIHSKRFSYRDGSFCGSNQDESLQFLVTRPCVELDLIVSVYEHKARRKRLAAKETYSLNFMDRDTNQRQIVMNSHDGILVLNILHQSDYALWLHQELDARRREETLPVRKSFYAIANKKNEQEDDYDGLWELCCVY